MINTTCNPYINFDGNCREAMEYYCEILKGELQIMTFADAPFDTDEASKELILHAALMFGDEATFMASDIMPGMELKAGNNSHISIQIGSMEEATRIFSALSEGGSVTMPFEDTFWGARFGMCSDRYGTNWMINCPLS